jgi:AcrR family transcriptional regulator
MMPRIKKTERAAGRKRRAPARSDEDKQLKYESILQAAMDEFLDKGFAGARLDEIAARAGVAKGTLYLYTESKEALFEDLIRFYVVTAIESVERTVADPDIDSLAKAERAFALMTDVMLTPPRSKVIVLASRELHRFPRLREYYYRQIISRGLAVIRGLCEALEDRFPERCAVLKQFPQIVPSPLVLAVIWNDLFAGYSPLDGAGMLNAFKQLLIPGGLSAVPLSGERHTP